MGEIYQYTLEGEMPKDPIQKMSYLTNLRTIQEWIVTPRLKSVAGVNEINSFGGYLKQYEVIVSPEKLLKYAINVDDVHSAIGSNNENVGGNILERGTDQYIVRWVGLIKDVGDVNRITAALVVFLQPLQISPFLKEKNSMLSFVTSTCKMID